MKGVSFRIVVSGRVQGVFFRENTVKTAKRFGIKGWVRNRDDGTVEIIAEGRDNKMRNFIDWCKKGPELSKVENVDIKRRMFSGDFRDFEIVGRD